MDLCERKGSDEKGAGDADKDAVVGSKDAGWNRRETDWRRHRKRRKGSPEFRFSNSRLAETTTTTTTTNTPPDSRVAAFPMPLRDVADRPHQQERTLSPIFLPSKSAAHSAAAITSCQSSSLSTHSTSVAPSTPATPSPPRDDRRRQRRRSTPSPLVVLLAAALLRGVAFDLRSWAWPSSSASWLPSASAQTSSTATKTVLRSFPTLLDGLPGSTLTLNRMAIDHKTGNVYLATVNGLYQLDRDLKQLHQVRTGPQRDSAHCGPGVALNPDSAKHCSLKLTNAVNKALVIDELGNRIIVCSNLYQGLCELRRLSNISDRILIVRNETLVGNDETSSTFAFVSPGPNGQRVLMVGVTYTGLGPYNSEVPAVSSRSLGTPLFRLAHKGISKGTEFKVNAQHLNEFRIQYKYGFHHREFSYFITVQREGLSSNNYVTRLVRVCQSDKEYHSYTELPLVCGNSGANYNVLQAAYFGKAGHDLASSLRIDPDKDGAVLYGVFSVGQTAPFNDVPTSKSALCVFSLKSVRRAFRNGIKKCFSEGKGMSGLDFNGKIMPCTQMETNITDSFCGDTVGLNSPLGLTDALAETAAVSYQDVNLTSVVASTTGNYTTVFLGTDDGRLRKLVVEARSLAVEYDVISLHEGSRILPEMAMDARREFVYVMSEHQLDKIAVTDCSEYSTCDECTGARDPYCGWCSMENRCSRRSECANADAELHWLPYNKNQCISLRVNPDSLQRTDVNRLLHLEINNLPPLDSFNHECVFHFPDGTQRSTLASRTSTPSRGGGVTSPLTLSCRPPSRDRIPPNPSGEDHIVVRLSVRVNSKDFVSANFTFFDCDAHDSCTRCVASRFNCFWCMRGHMCTHDVDHKCKDDSIVTSADYPRSSRKGPDFCPRIESTTTQILTPDGTAPSLNLHGINLQDFHNNLRCRFGLPSGVTRDVHAFRTGNDIIECEKFVFTYEGSRPNVTVSFTVTWGNERRLDNPSGVGVVVYKCAHMANSCGRCLALAPAFACGWCGSTCTTQDECKGGRYGANVIWLDALATCPNPSITSFFPKSGPKEGGTDVTIEGLNLGQKYEDIKDGVLVAGIVCVPYKNLYETASRIVCRTGASRFERQDHVWVRVNRFEGRSTSDFTYVTPSIRQIEPKRGPKSGGTTVIVHGDHLDAGSKVQVWVAEFPCSVEPGSRQKSRLVCVTSAASSGAAAPALSGAAPSRRKRFKLPGGVKMTMDWATIKAPKNVLFEYVDDPQVIAVEPLKVVVSGGNSLLVRGTRLGIIQNPRMFIKVGSAEFRSRCRVKNDDLMTCVTPDISASGVKSSYESPVEVHYGFLLDAVAAAKTLTQTGSLDKIKVYPDPVFEAFPEKDKKIKIYKYAPQSYLTVNGRIQEPDINVLRKEDIRVKIGTGNCGVTSVAPSAINCQPPEKQPDPLKVAEFEGQPLALPVHERNLPQVLVVIGNKTYGIGYLQYEDNGILPFWLKVAIGVAGGVLLLVLCFFGVAYKRKSSKSRSQLAHLQNQMDVLESRVAKECKEAFAELQTDVSEITSDLAAGGIPFLDYKNYMMRVLFPTSNEAHPVAQEHFMGDINKNGDCTERGLRLFGNLVTNRTFLLAFIRTLEADKKFSMRDRVNVASLVMVALQSKMEYCTEILKTLLAELIEKSIEGKSHPKLLLRRAESIAEKMLTNWFTALLYKNLRECSGEPLFMLARAIKQQVEKGPVDFVTHEARFSLSEDKLIRQPIDYRAVTLNVQCGDLTPIPPASVGMQVTSNGVGGVLFGHPQHHQASTINGYMVPPVSYVASNPHGVSMHPSSSPQTVQVRVLDCDCISQVKDKILDAFYKSAPWSLRPCREDLDLEWRTFKTARVLLNDDDSTTKTVNHWKRLNTIAHFRIPDGALLAIMPRQSFNLSALPPSTNRSLRAFSPLNGSVEYHSQHPAGNGNAPWGVPNVGGHGGGGWSMPSPMTSGRVSGGGSRDASFANLRGSQGLGLSPHTTTEALDPDHGVRVWHLVKPQEVDKDGESREGKMVSEVYLTRLLATKGTLQQYVDDLIETIFSTAHRGSALPLAIKYMFDFLDDQAIHHGVTDPEVVHTWKSNSLPLRFWVNLIKNPNFIFDIHKSNILDACLSVVAQTFMDSCSMSAHQLGKDSPSSKLLYAKDIPKYKQWVERYYRDIQLHESYSDQDMAAMLAEESRNHANDFNTTAALQELYSYAAKYSDALLLSLEDDEFARKNKLAYRLEQVHAIMQGDA